MAKSTFVWFGRGGDPPPPPYSTVDGPDAAKVRASLAARLGMKDEPGSEIARTMLARSECVGTITDTVRLDIVAVLADRTLPTPEHVLLAWDPLQTFFDLRFREFVSALPFLFELEVFDLLVLDQELRWGVYLMHYGEIRVFNLDHEGQVT